MSVFSEKPTSWKIILEPLTGNIVTFKVHDLMYVILSKAEKHVLYGKLVGTTKRVMS
jgi:hypothetical protein